MTMEETETEDWSKDYDSLCYNLSMDEQSVNEAKRKYLQAEASVKLVGKPIYWLACSLYECCFSRRLVLMNGEVQSGNYLPLNQLLTSIGLSFEEFIHKYLNDWSIVANTEDEFYSHVEKLRRKWVVMKHIFKKYKQIFEAVCVNIPADHDFKIKRVKVQRTVNSSELYKFIWTFYCYIKTKFPHSIEDVMSSSQLLLAVMDYCFGEVYLSDATILSESVQECFRLSENNSIIEKFCEDFISQLRSVEPKRIRDYHLKPLIKDLFEENVLKAKEDRRIFDSAVFDVNVKNIKNEYDTFILKRSEYDNRLFLDSVSKRPVGDRTPTKSTVVSRTPSEASMKVRRNLIKDLEMDNVPQTPLSNRSFLPPRTEEDKIKRTPISEQADVLNRLNNLIIKYKSVPSDILEDILSRQPNNVRNDILQIQKTLSEKFVIAYCNGEEKAKDFALQRLDQCSRLFYRMFELIISSELQRCSDIGIQRIMSKMEVISALFAMSVEIVLNTYGSNERKFPWVLHVFNLHSFHVYKVIELIIMNDTGLSRKIIKHLNTIEETMLETMVWVKDSPIYEMLSRCNPSKPPQYKDVKPKGNSTPNIVRSDDFRHQRFGAVNHGGIKRNLMAMTPLSSTPSPFEQMDRPGPGQPQPNIRIIVPTPSPILEIQHHSPPRAQGAQTPISALASTVNSLGVMSPPPQPRYLKSLQMFFRKIYNLIYLRMKNIAEKLELRNETLQTIWTVFEHALTQHLSLFHNRHIDQILICSTYLVTKAASMNITFRKIIEYYREQPQVKQHIYRNVLLKTDNLPPDLACGCVISWDGPAKGDIIKFYNNVFTVHLTPFIRLTDSQNPLNLAAPLSPMPTMYTLVPDNANTFSPRRIESHNISVSPRKPYIFGQSPTKQLDQFNKDIQSTRSKTQKRAFFDVNESDSKNTNIKKSALAMKYDTR